MAFSEGLVIDDLWFPPFLLLGTLLVALLLVRHQSESKGWAEKLLFTFVQEKNTASQNKPSPIDLGLEKNIEVSKESGFGDDWHTSEAIFELERRAIFGRAWHCLTHTSRIPSAGSYVTLPATSALPPLFVIRDRSLIPRAFHNVCRHRAYTVTRKESGTALILGCRYHGWCYDTRGKLVKAPQFDRFEGFKKEDNGLWEVRCATDREGWVWVCVDARDLGDGSLDQLDVEGIGMGKDIAWLKGWDLQGRFNWKIVEPGDLGIHLNLRSKFLPEFSWPWTAKGQAWGISPTKTGISSFLGPIPGTPLWLHTAVFPNSATNSAIHFNLYSSDVTRSTRYHQEACLEALRKELDTVVQNLEAKFTDSCAQGENKTLVNDGLLKFIKIHVREERIAGRQILPWVRMESRSELCTRAEKICQELDALAEQQQDIDKRSSYAGLDGLDW